jgi:hypothetical protein
MSHDSQHAGLAAMQDRIDRRWQHAYERAKRLNVHAPRKFADHDGRSMRLSQYYAWRTHLHTHGVRVPTFATLAELQTMHDELHADQEAHR